MRKWTYLVAALLMSGTAATFTSCIDTEEPAGITDLRGAKAELLRAKAAYQTALANEKQAVADFKLVQVERQKIELEMDKLRQEMMAAENEWKKDSLQARRDTLAASLEIKLVEMQQKKAWADYGLQKALEEIDAALITMKDNIYGQEISKYRVLLAGGPLYDETGEYIVTVGAEDAALAQLESAENTLIQKQILMTKFMSESATTEAELTANLAEAKTILEIQQGLLDDLNEIEKAEDLPALLQQKADKLNEQAALDIEEGEKLEEVLKLRDKASTFAKDLADLRAKLDTPDKYVVKKADVKSETMYESLKDYLSYYNPAAGESFSEDAAGKCLMDEDVEFSIDMFKNKAAEIKNILNYVSSYQYEYSVAYENITGEYPTASDMFNIDGSLKDVYRAKVDNQYDRWAIDAAARKATAEADLAAWLKAYENYMTALKKYKNYQGTEAHSAVSDAINKYNALDNAKKDLTAANAIRETIYDYAVLREAADGHVVQYYDGTSSSMESFIEKYKDPIPAAPSGSTTNTELDNFNINCLNLDLGSESLDTYFYINQTISETNTLGIYIAATYKVFGEDKNIAEIVQPEAYQDGEDTKYRMPADYEPTGGSYKLYLEDANVEDIITDIDNWAALYKVIYDDAQTVSDEIAEVYKQIDDLQFKSLDDLKVLWAAEVELYLIKGSESVNGNDVFTNENPYETYYENNDDIPTKYNNIDKQIALIQTAIDAGDADNFTAVLYDPTNGYYIYEGTLDGIISAQETKVETASSNVVDAQLLLDLFKEHGFNGASSSAEATENNCQAILQNAIDKQTEIVKIKNDEVERLKSVLEELLAAASAE